MEEIFLDHSKKYIIYGAGGNCINLLKAFEKSEIQVSAIIDKRADSLPGFYGKPVYQIENIGDVFLCKKDVVVIVSTKNVFEHSSIARELRKYGFRNIIYKPLSILKGSTNHLLAELDKVFECIMSGEGLLTSCKLPVFEDAEDIYYSDKLKIIEGDTVTTWLPIELLFNYNDNSTYSDLSLPMFFPLIDLYRALLGNSDSNLRKSIEHFIVYSSDWLKKNNLELSDSLKKSLVESRVAIYSEMQRTAEIDADFFKRNAPNVIAKEKSHFNLTNSGRNRLAFLIAKGFKYVPVCMTKNDYEGWYNREKFKDFADYIQEKNIYSFFSIIPHPLLVDKQVEAVDYGNLFVHKAADIILKEIYANSLTLSNGLLCFSKSKIDENIKNVNILTAINDDGNLSRYFSSLGFQVNRYYDENFTGRDVETVEKIDQLLDIRSINTVKLEDASKYNTVIGIVDDRGAISTLKQMLNLNISKVFFLNWRRNPEFLDCFQKNDFLVKGFLFETIWSNQMVEGRYYERK